MQQASFAIPVKIWALVCTTIGISLTANPVYTGALTLMGFIYLVLQKNYKFLRACIVILGVLATLLYLIRYHDLHMILFSEFYVLMFWNLFPVAIVGWDLLTTSPGELASFMSKIKLPAPFILGLLVMFRFFPTMKSELKNVLKSMKNRGLTNISQVLGHPFVTFEYILIPCLLRCIQIADELAVSAVARGAERPGTRGSYYAKTFTFFDGCMITTWTITVIVFLYIGGIR